MDNNSSLSSSKKTFSVAETFSFGWNKTFQNIKFYIVSLIVVGIVYFVLEYLVKNTGFLGIVFYIILLIFGFIFGYLFILTALKVYNNEKLELSKISSYMKFTNLFWNYVGGSILIGIGFMIAYLLILGSFALTVHFRSIISLLFIVIAIVLSVFLVIYAIALSFWSYILIDQNKQIIESMKESYHITKGKKWKIFGILLLLAILNVVGAVLLFVGLLVTIPMTILSFVFLYKKLEEIA